jgi:hypothetical protein
MFDCPRPLQLRRDQQAHLWQHLKIGSIIGARKLLRDSRSPATPI